MCVTTVTTTTTITIIIIIIIIICSSAGALHTYVKDVISVSRFHQLLNNLPIDSK
jgi:hypothetical protein